MVAFADETVFVVQANIVMATADNAIEGMECYTVELLGTTDAADNLFPVDTAEVCIIDQSCKYFQWWF